MTDGSGRILWSPRAALQPLESLPLRLRDGDGAVYAEGMSGSEFEARPGSYRLAITLPTGVELISRDEVRIEEGKLAVPECPDLDQALLALRDTEPAAAAAPLQAAVAGEFVGDAVIEAPPVAACRWSGDFLSLWSDAEEGTDIPDPLAVDGSLAFDFEIGAEARETERQSGPDDLLLIRNDQVRRAFILPGDRDIWSKDRLRIKLSLAGGADMPRLAFQSPLGDEANVFFQYVEKGMLGEARRISLDLLGDNSSPPGEMHGSLMRAVLAGYVFLRANELKEAGWLTERLVVYAPDVPDVHIIRMESLARLGGQDNHYAAVEALRTALGLGCPWFRSGVSYALERLRLYLGADSAQSVEFNLKDPADLARWRNRFHRMIRRLDPLELFATFNL